MPDQWWQQFLFFFQVEYSDLITLIKDHISGHGNEQESIELYRPCHVEKLALKTKGDVLRFKGLVHGTSGGIILSLCIDTY